MSYAKVPVALTGPSYPSRSRPLSSQTTRGFYQEYNEGLKSPYTLMPFPGLTLISSVSGKDRGQHEMDGIHYRVAGNTLYSVTVGGVHNALGNISGSERCIFADDGINLFINHDGVTNQWDGSTITTVTDSDLTGAKSIDFINNLFLFTGDRFTSVSDVGDGSSGSGLNVIGAESNPDRLVRDFVFQQNIFRAGTKTIEPWYNSGVGNPPIDRISGLIFQVGVAAKHSMAHTDLYIYWLGDDKNIYRGTTAGFEIVSSIAIAGEIGTYEKIDDAFATTFKFQGQHFYMITFPTANKTWVVNEALGTGGWFELSYGVDGGAFNCSSILNVHGENRLADATNGNLYRLDVNSSTFNDKPIQRVRVTDTIDSTLLGVKGRTVQMSEFELFLERGIGKSTTESPQISIEASYDGGKSWDHKNWINTGIQGDTQIRAIWHDLRVFRELIVRITSTDDVPVFIYGATINLKLAGY